MNFLDSEFLIKRSDFNFYSFSVGMARIWYFHIVESFNMRVAYEGYFEEVFFEQLRCGTQPKTE